MDTCTWKQSVRDYEDSTWETSCGFTLYTPSEDWDDWKYCPYCGQELVRECAKNTEQQVQPDNAEQDEVPFGYYPNNEVET